MSARYMSIDDVIVSVRGVAAGSLPEIVVNAICDAVRADLEKKWPPHTCICALTGGFAVYHNNVCDRCGGKQIKGKS